jgi:streptomycin 6-kinase
MRVPESLAWWAGEPGGREWLERLPDLAAACAERWRLELGAPIPGGNVALVLAAMREDGSPAVVKISFPEEESEHEPDALAHWDGRGAVRVLERDGDRRAMLLERVSPGTPLWQVADDEAATSIAAEVLRRLHGVPVRPGHPFASLADAAARWSETIPADWRATGKAFPARLVDVAVDACRTLVPDPVGEVLLHQDLHGGNVLRFGPDEWLAIDPKPLVGDPAFDVASLLRDRRWLLGGVDDAHRVRRRLDVLAEVTGLDRERMRLWGIVHALAWGVSGGAADAEMIRCGELLLGA